MKLTASMMLTLDGVYQGPGGPDEDRRDGFDRGGWTAAYGDEEGWAFLTAWFERADAFLLGRKTWEIWEPYWPLHDGGDPVSHGINVLPKYVPSTNSRLCVGPRSAGCSSATSSTSSTFASTRSSWATGSDCSRTTARRTTSSWS